MLLLECSCDAASESGPATFHVTLELQPGDHQVVIPWWGFYVLLCHEGRT